MSGVINMQSMFNGASGFDQDLGAWNVSSVSDMTSMLVGSGLLLIITISH